MNHDAYVERISIRMQEKCTLRFRRVGAMAVDLARAEKEVENALAEVEECMLQWQASEARQRARQALTRHRQALADIRGESDERGFKRAEERHWELARSVSASLARLAERDRAAMAWEREELLNGAGEGRATGQEQQGANEDARVGLQRARKAVSEEIGRGRERIATVEKNSRQLRELAREYEGQSRAVMAGKSLLRALGVQATLDTALLWVGIFVFFLSFARVLARRVPFLGQLSFRPPSSISDDPSGEL